MLQLLYSPFPSHETARQAATALLDAQLVACCNLLPGCESYYRWQGVLTCSTEVILIAKTTPDAALQAQHLLRANHPYACPAILSISATSTEEYTAWVNGSLAGVISMHQSD